MKRLVLLIMLFAPFIAFAQGLNVKGTVTDVQGNPLPGASIMEKNTTNGTIADMDGNFSMNVANNQSILIFSFIGCVTVEETVGNRTSMTIVMKDDVKRLEEVVVVGYGQMKKSDLSGSVASLGKADLENRPLASIEQGLRGKLAGVQVSAITGAPGAGSTMRIRGGTSITAGMEPLYVIDGILIYNDKKWDSMDPLSTISPSDIESIDILKDASAAAIYGARGANGVVIVTTKRGSEGGTTVNVNTKIGIQTRAKKLDMANGDEFRELMLQGYEYSSSVSSSTPAYEKRPEIWNTNTDWQDEVFQSAVVENYDVNISGGTEKMRHSLSLGYFNQDGIVIGSDFNRLSGKANVDYKFSKYVGGGTTFMLTSTTKNFVDVLMNAVRSIPIMPVKEENGAYAYMRDWSGYGTGTNNPVAQANDNVDKTVSDRVISNSYLTIYPLEGLELKASVGFDVLNSNYDSYVAASTESGRSAKGISNILSSRRRSMIFDAIATYNKTIDDHRFSIMGGWSADKYTATSRGSNSRTYPDDYFQTNNVGAAEVINSIASNKAERTVASILGRANYSYKDKYLLTATIRRDGASHFGENSRWANFPSIAVAWRITEESFLKDNPTLTYAKIRVSYGEMGNMEIGNYQSLQRIAVGNVALNNTGTYKGYYTSSLGNPNLTWETTNQFDSGFDLTLWDRINITFDYYQKTTDGVLFNLTPALSTGFGSILDNAGKISNKGVELSVGALVVSTKDWKWNVNMNISHNKNKIEDLGGSSRIIGDVGNMRSIIDLGKPVGVFYGYKTDGLFQSWEDIANTPYAANWTGAVIRPGYLKYQDIGKSENGQTVDGADGKIDENDMTIIGDPNPDFTYGFSTNVTWKKVDFGLSLYGSYGNDIYNVALKDSKFFSGNMNVLKDVTNSSITELTNSGDPSKLHITNVQPATFGTNGRHTHTPSNANDANVEDGSFLRVSDISLGYTFDLKKLNLGQKVRVYFTVQNPFTITGYSGFDPDVNSNIGRTEAEKWANGYDQFSYPVARTYFIGANYTF
jgi:TonB-linked outer membrane protein, SusC/RagA family/TonB-dependent outer membrane receptor, SusC/RagA subfamily, signature region